MADLADCIRKYFVINMITNMDLVKVFGFRFYTIWKYFVQEKKHLIISNKYIHCISTHVHLAIMFISIMANGHLEYVDK